MNDPGDQKQRAFRQVRDAIKMGVRQSIEASSDQ